MSSRSQIALIHTLISKLKIPDEHYRDMLASYNVRTSKELSFKDSRDFINVLIKMASGKDVYVPKTDFKPYEKLGNRPDMAYPSQLRKITAMWFEVSRQQTDDEKRSALNAFIKRQWGIDRIEWLPRNLVGKVIATITAMKGYHGAKNDLQSEPSCK